MGLMKDFPGRSIRMKDGSEADTIFDDEAPAEPLEPMPGDAIELPDGVLDFIDESDLPEEQRTPRATPGSQIVTFGGEAEREEIRRRSAALKNEVLAWRRANGLRCTSQPTADGANEYSEWAKELVARSRMAEREDQPAEAPARTDEPPTKA